MLRWPRLRRTRSRTAVRHWPSSPSGSMHTPSKETSRVADRTVCRAGWAYRKLCLCVGMVLLPVLDPSLNAFEILINLVEIVAL